MSDFNIGGVNVFKAASFVTAVGFAWFTFVSPEAANAAAKADGFLLAFFASLALYFYSQCKCKDEICDKDSVSRRIDQVEDDIMNRINDIWREVDRLEQKCCNDSVCSKKSR